MSRYRAREAWGLWSVVDRRTGEVLPRDEILSGVDAHALADVLNSLENQQDWHAEARLWPVPA
jgi:hypothetical protein